MKSAPVSGVAFKRIFPRLEEVVATDPWGASSISEIASKFKLALSLRKTSKVRDEGIQSSRPDPTSSSFAQLISLLSVDFSFCDYNDIFNAGEYGHWSYFMLFAIITIFSTQVSTFIGLVSC